MPDKLDGRYVATAPRRRRGPQRLSELPKDQPAAAYGKPWNAWGIGRPHGVLVYGPPGAGKSTLLSHLAASAGRRVPVLYVSVEEGNSANVRERIERCAGGWDDLLDARVTITDCASLAELGEDVDMMSKDAIVLIDSQTQMRVSLDAVTSRLDGRSWVVTQHVTTAGLPRGGFDASHAADVVVLVDDGIALPTKNRWGGMTPINVWSSNEAVSLPGVSEQDTSRAAG